jgi:hypothetical protein
MDLMVHNEVAPVAFITTSVPKNHTAWPSSLASAYG